MWFDDLCFDNFEEVFCGRLFAGEDWRRVQHLKEAHQVENLMCVAGCSFYTKELEESLRRANKEGFKIRIEAEPDSTFDKNAKRVTMNGLKVGYVPRDHKLGKCGTFHVARYGLNDKQSYVWLAY